MPNRPKKFLYSPIAQFLPENQRNGEVYIPERASRMIRGADVNLWQWVVDSAYYERKTVAEFIEPILWAEHDRRKAETERQG